MAWITCNERQLAIVVNIAGLPGISVKAPSARLRPDSQDEAVVAYQQAWAEALPAIWNVLAEHGLLESSEPILKRSAESLAKLTSHRNERVRKTAASNAQALQAWPTKQPDMAKPAYGKLLNIQLWQDEGTESSYEPVDSFVG